MLVRYRMSSRVVVVQPDLSLAGARALLQRKHIRQLPVVHGTRLVGIVTDRDLRGARAAAKVVRDVMTPRPHVVSPDAAVDEAAHLLRRYKINALPVMEKRRLVGILTASDVLTAFVDLSGAGEPTYRLLITAEDARGTESRVRYALQHGGAELKWLHRDRKRRRQLHLRVKARQIGDVETALEAAGFEVNAIIASCGRRRS